MPRKAYIDTVKHSHTNSASPEPILLLGSEGLGVSATALPEKLRLSQPAVTISVKRGEKIAKEKGFEVLEKQFPIILWTSPHPPSCQVTKNRGQASRKVSRR